MWPWSSRRERVATVLLHSVAGIPVNSSPDCHEFKEFEVDTLRRLGQGSYGTVFEACKNGRECHKYVAKLVHFKEPEFLKADQRNFLIEALMSQIAGQYNISPPVYTFFFCDKGRTGVLIMKRMQPIGTLTEKDVFQLLNKVKLMHDAHILHCDLFLRNVMRDPVTKHLYILDFGLAFLLSRPVPDLLRATDIAGLIWGQPPELHSGISERHMRIAKSVWQQLPFPKSTLETGLQLRVNRNGTFEEPEKGKEPYKIDCRYYYRLIRPLVDKLYLEKLGKVNAKQREVWFSEGSGRSIC